MNSSDVLYVIDLDRTLIDTDKVISLLVDSLNDSGIDGKAFVKRLEKARLDEADLDAKKEIDKFGTDVWEKFSDYFHAEANKQKVVYDDANNFLAKLDSLSRKYMILTYGVSKQWQELKISAAGFGRIKYVISNTRDKSRLIQGWLDNRNIYHPPGFDSLKARNVILIDDRPASFVYLNKNLTGYLVDRKGTHNKNHKFPSSIKIVKSFEEISLEGL